VTPRRFDVRVRLFRWWRSCRSYWPGVIWRLYRFGGMVIPAVDASEHRRVNAAADGRGSVIAINRRRKELRLYRCEGGSPILVRSYRVGVGRRTSRTPSGNFAIQNMLRDPVWHVPDNPWRFGSLAGTAVPPGAPENRILARWIGFNGGIGIHGSTPGPFGLGSSGGCVRMSRRDAVEIFDLVDPGTPIVIV